MHINKREDAVSDDATEEVFNDASQIARASRTVPFDYRKTLISSSSSSSTLSDDGKLIKLKNSN